MYCKQNGNQPFEKELWKFLSNPFGNKDSTNHNRIVDSYNKLSKKELRFLTRTVIEEKKQIQQKLTIFMESLVESLNYLVSNLKTDINVTILLVSYIERRLMLHWGETAILFKTSCKDTFLNWVRWLCVYSYLDCIKEEEDLTNIKNHVIDILENDTEFLTLYQNVVPILGKLCDWEKGSLKCFARYVLKKHELRKQVAEKVKQKFQPTISMNSKPTNNQPQDASSKKENRKWKIEGGDGGEDHAYENSRDDL